VLARYELLIDRTRDILRMKSLPIGENERYRSLFTSRSTTYIPHQEEKIVLKEIKKPIKQVTWEGLKIRIEFVVENWGKEKNIYPYVEYKVVDLKNGKHVERIVHSPLNWEVKLQAFSSTPIAFDSSFPADTHLLAKGEDKVKVRIKKSPWKL